MPPRLALIILVVWVGSSAALGLGTAWLVRRASGRRWAWWLAVPAVPLWMLVGVAAVRTLGRILGKL